MSKKSREAKNVMFIQLLENYQKTNVCHFTKFTSSHFRVWTPTQTIDFYLSGMKYHDINKQIRGDFDKLTDFELILAD